MSHGRTLFSSVTNSRIVVRRENLYISWVDFRSMTAKWEFGPLESDMIRDKEVFGVCDACIKEMSH